MYSLLLCFRNPNPKINRPTMWKHLPNEVMMDIFTRLPVKTLLRIRCVSKSWYNLINDQHFHTLWLARKTHLNNTHLLLLKHYTEHTHDKQEHFSLHFDDDSLTRYPLDLQIGRPVAWFWSYFTVVGSCNGLVCLVDDKHGHSDSRLYLWNPTVWKFVVVPRPRIAVCAYSDEDRVLGFGFDSVMDDYKIVRVIFRGGFSELRVYSHSIELEIYSLREGVWRDVSVSGNIPPIPCELSQAFLNGSIHWVSRGLFIVVFDLGTAVFSRMELPTSLADHTRIGCELSLGVFQDTLCVFHSDRNRKQTSIWVMKEYGVLEWWTNLYSLEYGEGFAQSVKVIGLRRNGRVLLAKDDLLISADIARNTLKYLRIRGCHAAYSVNTYTESLVLIDKTNELQEK